MKYCCCAAARFADTEREEGYEEEEGCKDGPRVSKGKKENKEVSDFKIKSSASVLSLTCVLPYILQ